MVYYKRERHMKHKLLSVVLAVMAGPACMAADIHRGDSLECVISCLGQPQGYMQTDHRSVLYYERGRVELEHGRVVSASLISPEAACARRIERSRQEELARQAAAKRAAEGQALRDGKLCEPAFLALPANSRFAYWQTFMRNYPGVPVGMDYEVAQREVRAEAAAMQAEADRMRQYAELQDRAVFAEQRAAEAEALARQSYSSFSSYSYPLFVHSPHFIRPPINPSCMPQPRGHDMNMGYRAGQQPAYAHVGTSPNPRDYGPAAGWTVSYNSRRRW
jgi:hypothetical protein